MSEQTRRPSGTMLWMRRAGTIGFVFLWLLTLVGGPLSRVAQALPQSIAPASAPSQCKMSHKPGKPCCCGGEETTAVSARTSVSATPPGCHCSLTQAPLPPTDETPRVLLSETVVLPSPAFRSVPPVPALTGAVSPHVGTLAPPGQVRPRAPDVGRAPPVTF